MLHGDTFTKTRSPLCAEAYFSFLFFYYFIFQNTLSVYRCAKMISLFVKNSQAHEELCCPIQMTKYIFSFSSIGISPWFSFSSFWNINFWDFCCSPGTMQMNGILFVVQKESIFFFSWKLVTVETVDYPK